MKRAKVTCVPHLRGVPPGTPPFFHPGCSACERKRAEGKVRGDEGPLPRYKPGRSTARNTS